VSEALAQVEEQEPLTPGELIARMKRVRAVRKKLATRDKKMVEMWRDLDARLVAALDRLGMRRASSDEATATITEEELPVPKDWDEIDQYILDNAAVHLLQRRLSTSAWRELQQAGTEIPGVTTYTKRSISLRNR